MRVVSAGPGARLSRYHLVQEISRGGMGIVYRALDPTLADLERGLPLRHGGGPLANVSSVFTMVRYTLGLAYLAAGRASDAEAPLRRVVESTTSRVGAPVEYVRAFYLLGMIYEQLGERPRAREHYARFLEHWRDGDLDRDKVADAERKLKALTN